MDKKRKAAIQKHYQDEYMRTALDKKSGGLAKMTRSLMGPGPMSRQARIGLSLLGAAQGSVVAGSVAVGAVVVGGLVPALLGIPVGLAAVSILMAPVNIPLVISLLKAKGTANKAIDNDIKNGSLVDRYQTEVLDKLAANKPESKARKFFKRTAKQDFSAAANDVNTTKPAAPKHRFSLQHQPKL